MRPRGFYWVKMSGDDPEIMEFSGSEWFSTGSDDYYVDDERVEVLAGPLKPPVRTGRRRVYLESPYRAETPDEAERNGTFLRCCMLDSIRRGEAPLASHIVYAPLLDESIPAERAMGMECGFAWGEVGGEATVVYTNLGITPGMRDGIEEAERVGRPVEYRELPDWSWP